MQSGRLLARVLAWACVLTVPASALAQAEAERKIERHANIGQTVRLGGHVNYGPHCSGVTQTTIIVIRQPNHGTLAVKDEMVTSENPELGARCAGQSGLGRVVYYIRTSSGLDKFRYDSSFPSGVVHMDVTVN